MNCLAGLFYSKPTKKTITVDHPDQLTIEMHDDIINSSLIQFEYTKTHINIMTHVVYSIKNTKENADILAERYGIRE